MATNSFNIFFARTIPTEVAVTISNARLTRKLKLVAMAIFICIASGCVAVTNTTHEIDKLDSVGDNPRVLIMTPDVKYYLLTAGGMPEPHAEWTTAARTNFSNALQEFADERGTEIVVMDDEEAKNDTVIAYQKLYQAVGASILATGIKTRLHSKADEFDWTLGPGVKPIGEHYEADYALFSYFRDYQASGGRMAFALIAAAAGASVGMGSESGFASLVDLNTGQIVWFNFVASGSGGGGELREVDGAAKTVELLFKDLPAD